MSRSLQAIIRQLMPQPTEMELAYARPGPQRTDAYGTLFSDLCEDPGYFEIAFRKGHRYSTHILTRKMIQMTRGSTKAIVEILDRIVMVAEKELA